MKKIISKTAMGIAWGCTILVAVMLIGIFINPDFIKSYTAQQFAKHVICSAIAGIGFYLPSIVYDNEKLSRPLQIIIHLGIGFAIYALCVFVAGWIPTTRGFIAVAVSISTSLVFSIVAYFCFYLYNKNEVKRMNIKIKEKTQLTDKQA